MAQKKIKKPTKRRLAILLKRKQTRKTVEGADYTYTKAGNKRPTAEVWMRHFNGGRNGCDCEQLEDGRIYTSSKPADRPKGGVNKSS